MLTLQQCIPSKKGPEFDFQWGSFFQPQCGLCSTQSGT